MSDLIFHHFDPSPYSEKVRLIFGLKGLTWNSVQIPRIMPKPDFTALTGGYRRTPALQIGADIYCDTQLIAAELEKRHPAPSLFECGGFGVNMALSAWTDRMLFRPCVRYVFGTYADNLPTELLEDREKMSGRDLDVDAIKASAVPLLSQVHPQLQWIEDMLEDGREYLNGKAPSLVDFSVFHCVWFLNNVPKGAEQLEPYTKMKAWFERVNSIGHGTRVEMDSKVAIDVAKDADITVEKSDYIGSGPALGCQVSVLNEENVPDPVVGELVISSTKEIVVKRQSKETGDTLVHFPRIGYYATAL
ncbi:MAG: glutathione S-transferase family protein [Sneathiella sp.]